MKHSQMHKLMDEILETVISIRDEGQKEYAHDESDVFANFNRVANLLEEDRKKVLMTYMLKHIDGIAAYVKGHKSQREDVRGRITDCIVYLMLLWGMINEEDDIQLRKEDNESLCNVLQTLPSNDPSLSMDRGRSTSDGLQLKSNMSKMREKRSGIKEPKEMGRA